MNTSDKIAVTFITALLLGLSAFEAQEIIRNRREISDIKNQVTEIKCQLSTLKAYPEGYSESLAWYPATDPAGPEEQPTIEQPEIVHQTTNTVELQERIADPYIQALHGGK